MSQALASLTATYTDSEDENVDDPNDENPAASVTTPSGSPSDNKSNNSSRPNTPLLIRVTTKVAKLVSYHDDTIASDEDGDAEDALPQHEVIMMTNPEKNNSEDIEMLDENGVQLPPDPPGHCSIDLQDKIGKLHEKMQHQQLDMNELIQKRKDFRNPSIYEKLIKFCGIDEYGTNYPPTIYDPLKWGKESYYEELRKVQESAMEKREKERKSKVDIVSGTKKQEDDNKKRKSKWDQPGSSNLGSQNIKPAGLVQPSLTTSATGTKGTVISAFGSLPKKPRP